MSNSGHKFKEDASVEACYGLRARRCRATSKIHQAAAYPLSLSDAATGTYSQGPALSSAWKLARSGSGAGENLPLGWPCSTRFHAEVELAEPELSH